MSISEGDVEEFERWGEWSQRVVDRIVEHERGLGPRELLAMGLEMIARSAHLVNANARARQGVLGDLRHRLMGHPGTMLLCDLCRTWIGELAELERRIDPSAP